MQIAYDEAIKGMNANEGGPFGAVIVKDGEILAKAHNRVLATNDPTAHAEVIAIKKASQLLGTHDLSGCTLYATTQPCPMCLGAIFWARIKTVYYGTTTLDAAKGGFDDARFYEMIEGRNSDIAFKQIDHEACAEIFEQWDEKEDKQLY
ncbi:nucleoside deaminase [Sulfurovum mangrovi]|uniref:nucleoside deaminase n=1 Tax=Sulfurovum mangrovi TaxID=2893889 RepID=UPI001E287AC4|nr:nucleoside deaminase [Sulfurovum mangrovi]UFH60374.1 nucleoside deaminase [Sulfurovum mangrovi]